MAEDNTTAAARLNRARGCLLGQLAGDSLGSLVEFMRPEEIREEHPDGVWDLEDGGTWNTLAGQPTDDSEMALALARSLVERGAFNPAAVRSAYQDWLHSHPFDMGNTVSSGLRGFLNHESQANGALMRVSPLGIFGAGRPEAEVAAWAVADAAITHPNPVCTGVNVLFTLAVAHAVDQGPSPEALYERMLAWTGEWKVPEPVRKALTDAADAPPDEFTKKMGWVLIAFQNAVWQLLHAPSLEDGVVDTVMRGGDTDTNAAICGALLGAVHGLDAVPQRWVDDILDCRPEAGRPGVHRPRPESYWPVDALELAEALLAR
ncbi:MAG TPA: ADP-ribosylglycohydrolase family protein [Candidatus Hydrogenedentes bacterium]|nr:ADP-ribosylglycohydrolase family protein [Candidatus Hydrogenedentota bacterium]